ncbi:MAG: insulinase family protein [Deltaproteobacteria bacterium]|jgi:zinc protease|nr:insulinase family protein [Deltaproteobacteria bacterium]
MISLFKFFLRLAPALAFAFTLLLLSGPAYCAIEESLVLPNGLKVLLSPQEGKSVVFAAVVVKAGSASEASPEEYGLAHLMEHMAFKGTPTRKVGEISKLIETNGGSTNAFTSYDETTYFIIMPPEKLELSLDLLSDMTFNPSYDPEEYLKEKEVVIEEIRMGSDNPDRIIMEAFYGLAYPTNHPYSHRIIGFPETVQNATRETALKFHGKFYRPDNCLVVISGDFEPAAAKTLVEQYFGSIENPNTPLTAVVPPALEKNGPAIKVIYSPEAQLAKLFMGFHSPEAGNTLTPAVDLLASILSSGRSSRLEENIKNRLGLASSVFASSNDQKQGSLFLTGFETQPEQVTAALDALLKELTKLTTAPPDQQELERAKALTAKEFIDLQQIPWRHGLLLSEFEQSNDDFRIKDAYLTLWAKLKALDLAILAKDLFTPENMTMVLILPEGSQPIKENDLAALAKSLKLPEPTRPAAAEARNFQTFTLSNGAKVLFLRDATLPLVDIRAGFLAGRLAEEPGQEGLNHLMASVWTTATQARDSEETARLLDDLGLEIKGDSESLSTGMSASFVSQNLRQSLRAFCEILTSPAFNEKDLAVKKMEQLDYLASLDESLADRVFRLERLGLFREHPFHSDFNGTRQSVEKFTREDLLSQYQKIVRPENLIISVAGDISSDELLAALEEELSDWPAGDKTSPVTLPESPGPLQTPYFASEVLERSQTHLILGFIAPGVKSEDRAALEVLNSVLSGMGGLLFTELRDQKSLAYSVQSMYSARANIGTFLFYIASAPDKSAESYTSIAEIINRCRQTQFDQAVIEGAKTNLIGENLMSHLTLESLTNEALGFVLADQELDYNTKYLNDISKVTPADVQKVAQKYLVITQGALSVVGNADSIAQVQEANAQETNAQAATNEK